MLKMIKYNIDPIFLYGLNLEMGTARIFSYSLYL